MNGVFTTVFAVLKMTFLNIVNQIMVIVKHMKDPQTIAYLKTFYEEGIPAPKAEYKFCKDRKFRFDFAWPLHRVALEIEVGVFGKGEMCPTCKRKPVGAHSSVTGLIRDIEKYNLAITMGWAVVRCIPSERTSPATYETIRRMIATHCFKPRVGQ